MCIACLLACTQQLWLGPEMPVCINLSLSKLEQAPLNLFQCFSAHLRSGGGLGGPSRRKRS